MTATRGTSNGNSSGSAADRRRRRQWLLDTYGDGVTAPCALCPPAESCVLSFETLTVDRIVPGRLGGKYRRGNIQPACGPSNSRKGGAS